MLKIPKRHRVPRYVSALLITVGLTVGTAFAMTKSGNETMFPGIAKLNTMLNQNDDGGAQVKSATDSNGNNGQGNQKAKSTDSRAAGGQAGTNASGSATVQPAGGSANGTAQAPAPQGQSFTPGQGGGGAGGTSGGGWVGSAVTAPSEPTTYQPPVSGGGGGGSTGGSITAPAPVGGGGGGSGGGGGCLCETVTQPVQEAAEPLPSAGEVLAPAAPVTGGLGLWLLNRSRTRKLALTPIRA